MEGESEDKLPTKPPLKKHLSSTFTPMIGRYMSEDQLADHVSHQMSFFHNKYEPEEEAVITDKKKSKKKVKFKKSKQGSDANTTSDEETEKEIEKREHREGLRDRMLEDLSLLRDYYKRIYKKTLNEKVANQHKVFKHRDAEAMAREKKLKEKEEQQKHKVVVRLPKSKVLNDQSYKQDIQETGYHKIVKLEHQLKKQGYLSKVSEIQAFWNFILLPGNLARILEKGKLSWEEIQQYEMTHRSILESSENKDSNHEWCASDIEKLIAANAHAKHWKKTTHSRQRLFTPSGLSDISSSQSGRHSSHVSSKQKSAGKSALTSPLTMDQRFPKVEFPVLAAYTLVFGEKEPDPEEIEKELEMKRKEEAKRDARSKLLTMFSHALANRAATQRMMQRNKKFSSSQLVGTSSVRELLYHDTEKQLKTIPLTTEALQAHDNETRLLIQDGGKSAASDRRSPKPLRTGSPTNQTIGTDDKVLLLREYKRLPPIAVPLSLQGVEEDCSVKEAKGLSTLWVNPFLNKKSQVTSSQ